MLLIFDWDGTLMDSAGKIVRCMRAAAIERQLEPLEAEAIHNIIGLELGVAIGQLYPELGLAGVELMRAAYSRQFVEADQIPCSFFAGVGDGLVKLHAAGHTLCVATGKSRKGLNRVFSHLPEAALFAGSRCADETASKPHPLMLQELCDEFSVSPHEALMVGDTEYDLEMASKVGMPSIGVSYGAHAPERLLRWSPLRVVDQFTELVAYLEA